jgi:hypothetical protein
MRVAASSEIISLRSTRSVGLGALLGRDAGIGQRGRRQPADETLLEGALLVARLAADDPAPLLGAAVLLAGDHVLRDVDQAPG